MSNVETPSVSASPAGASPTYSLNERNWRRWAIVLLATLGWWLSFDLLRMGVGVNASNPLLRALCSAEGDSGCASVLQSHWGRIPLSQQPGAMSLPLALFGMAYFGVVLLWFFLVNGPYRGARWAHVLITALISLGIWQSASLVYVMSSLLHQWCLGCTTVHIVNALIALLVLSLLIWPVAGEGNQRQPSARDAEDSHRGERSAAVGVVLRGSILPRALGAAAAGLFAALFQIAYVLFMQNAMQLNAMNEVYVKIIRDPEYAAWNLARQPVVDLPVDPKRVVGPADAPNLIQAFVDPQCPVCRDLSAKLKEVDAKYPGRIRVIYRHFPLDRACNPTLPRSVHAAGCAAALRIAAAGLLEGPDEALRMRTAMYARQNELGVAPWSEFALTANIGPIAVETAAAGEAAVAEVHDDIELAKKANVSVVPVVFLNGKRFDSWREMPIEAWEKLLTTTKAASQAATRSNAPEKSPSAEQ